jgi:hypothetical protein
VRRYSSAASSAKCASAQCGCAVPNGAAAPENMARNAVSSAVRIKLNRPSTDKQRVCALARRRSKVNQCSPNRW